MSRSALRPLIRLSSKIPSACSLTCIALPGKMITGQCARCFSRRRVESKRSSRRILLPTRRDRYRLPLPVFVSTSRLRSSDLSGSTRTANNFRFSRRARFEQFEDPLFHTLWSSTKTLYVPDGRYNQEHVVEKAIVDQRVQIEVCLSESLPVVFLILRSGSWILRALFENPHA